MTDDAARAALPPALSEQEVETIRRHVLRGTATFGNETAGALIATIEALAPSPDRPTGLLRADADELHQWVCDEERLADALRDMTGAYHKECHHEGSYRRCQKPRCLNARLLLDGRRSEYESADVGVFDKP